jgi:hypothetical protein
MYDTAVISCFVNPVTTNNKSLVRECRSVIYHRSEMSKSLWKDFIALYNLQEKEGSDNLLDLSKNNDALDIWNRQLANDIQHHQTSTFKTSSNGMIYVLNIYSP